MIESEIVRVNLPGREYDIHVGAGILAAAGSLVEPLLRRKYVAIIADERVDALHGATLRQALDERGISHNTLCLPSGEGTKSWQYLEQTVEWLLAQKVERQDVVMAFGGGVIGDIVGFAAAILRRGVRFVQMPTTLLAQVDSSVGGKTGINSPSGKNLIGAFHQPSLVLADIDLLSTLTHRDYLSGYGEVVKYGALGSRDFFDWQVEHEKGIFTLNKDTLIRMVARSCAMKARIVEDDETEAGERALLNLGHTFGHALERLTGYSSRLLHGEGVSIGMGLAFDLSVALGFCRQDVPQIFRAHLEHMQMKTKISDIEDVDFTPEDILDAMYQDKKVVQGALNMILAKDIGEAFIAKNVNPDDVLSVLKRAYS